MPFISFFVAAAAQVDIGTVARDLHLDKYMWLDSPVGAWVEHRSPSQLILGEVDTPIRRHQKGVCP